MCVTVSVDWVAGLPWRAGPGQDFTGQQDFPGAKDFLEQDLTGWQAFAGGHG